MLTRLLRSFLRPYIGQVAIVDAGRIVEQGNHADLLRRRGVYYSLYNSQFTEDLAEAS